MAGIAKEEKMKKKLAQLLFLTIISFACSQDKGSQSLSTKLQEVFAEVDSEYLDHFPKEFDEDASIFISEEKFISHPKIWVKDLNVSNIPELESMFSKEAIAKYTSLDTCILILDRHLTEANRNLYDRRNGRPEKVTYSQCSLATLPIPKFWNTPILETPSSATGLDSDYVFFVIDAKNDAILKEDRLPKTRYAPAGWQHGYSRGIAINKRARTVIYWLDAW